MTGFEILLTLSIIVIINITIAIKYIIKSKPTDIEDWLLTITCSLFMILIEFISLIVLYLLWLILLEFINANWYSFFHNKII